MELFKNKKDEHDYIYNGGDENYDEYEFDESYEEVYDEDGYSAEVYCDFCGTEIRWKDGQYVCPNCNNVMSRAEFFNAIGAEPPGDECITCDDLYPGCVICPHGYVEDEY